MPIINSFTSLLIEIMASGMGLEPLRLSLLRLKELLIFINILSLLVLILDSNFTSFILTYCSISFHPKVTYKKSHFLCFYFEVLKSFLPCGFTTSACQCTNFIYSIYLSCNAADYPKFFGLNIKIKNISTFSEISCSDFNIHYY